MCGQGAVQLDRRSATPLYQQIAATLRYRIFAGEITPGTRLPALRTAAKEHLVNLHTVRRAYQVLELEGLLETVPTVGSVVTSWRPGSLGGDHLDRMLRGVLRAAEEAYGATPALVVERITNLASHLGSERAWVAECSLPLAERLAGQVAAAWRVEAWPWLVSRIPEVPSGTVISTSFHRADILRALPENHDPCAFVRVRLDESALVEELGESVAERLVLCDTDAEGGRVLAALIGERLGRQVELARSVSPASAVRRTPRDGRVLVVPGLWEDLADRWRRDRRVVQLPFEIVPEDLEAVGKEFGWVRRETPATS